MISDTTQTSIIQLAHQFRLGFHVQACLDLPDLLQGVLQQIADAAPSVQTDLDHLFACILQCQQAQDWLGLADYLEFEVFKCNP